MNTTAIDLHAAAQEATKYGMHDLAALLLFEAADEALTPSGRRVLLERAYLESARADLFAQCGFCVRVH